VLSYECQQSFQYEYARHLVNLLNKEDRGIYNTKILSGAHYTIKITECKLFPSKNFVKNDFAKDMPKVLRYLEENDPFNNLLNKVGVGIVLGLGIHEFRKLYLGVSEPDLEP
jgi:hypothetical protein